MSALVEISRKVRYSRQFNRGALQPKTCRKPSGPVLVCSQSDHWIDLRRSSCREVAGKQRNPSEQRHHPRKGERIGRRRVEEEGSDQPSDCDGSNDSDANADQGEPKRF